MSEIDSFVIFGLCVGLGVGGAEGIHGNKWFIGETDGTAAGARNCTAKTITSLGDSRGLCPEAPGQRGGFRVAGLAWYAHTNDIRPESIGNDH